MGIQNGALNSKALQKYREKNDVRVSMGKGGRGTAGTSRGFVNDKVVFGMPNRPSTPISGIITNVYGLEAEKQIDDLY